MVRGLSPSSRGARVQSRLPDQLFDGMTFPSPNSFGVSYLLLAIVYFFPSLKQVEVPGEAIQRAEFIRQFELMDAAHEMTIFSAALKDFFNLDAGNSGCGFVV